MKLKLYFATNRRHRGRDRWRPTGYGPDFSRLRYRDPVSGKVSDRSAAQNLRFGCVDWELDGRSIAPFLSRDSGWGPGDGAALAAYLRRPQRRRDANITAFEEQLDSERSDREQSKQHFGSRRSFDELRCAMRGGCDVLVFVHGFNVSWWEAVASAAALQLQLNDRRRAHDPELLVFLFSWPSDGVAVPWFSYYSDRDDASASGAAVGRAFLRLRDYLFEAWRDDHHHDRETCRQAFHLLCHSMGNFVLESALTRTGEFSRGGKLPRLFDQVFLCAPDVDDDAFEVGRGLHRLPDMAENVSVYFNRGDMAMPVSDYTKGNRDRLGWRGVSHPGQLDGRVHQVDCSDIVSGFLEHGYHSSGQVADDIYQSIAGLAPDDPRRGRQQLRNGWPNVWRLRTVEAG